MFITVTDNAGTSGAIACDTHHLAVALAPWYPDAPEDVRAAVADLEAALTAGDGHAATELAAYLDVTIGRAPAVAVVSLNPDDAGTYHSLVLTHYDGDVDEDQVDAFGSDDLASEDTAEWERLADAALSVGGMQSWRRVGPWVEDDADTMTAPVVLA